MSLLYKKQSEIKYQVDIKKLPNEKVMLRFRSDGGKFGTEELIDEHELTVKELLLILQQHEKNYDIISDFHNGKIQIYNDEPSKFNLLFKNPAIIHINIFKKYYKISFDGVTIHHDFTPFENIPIIHLSQLSQ